MAFNNLIARNKTDPMPDVEDAADAAKIKLPFIVVNTSKETAVDCWLSTDRSGLLLTTRHYLTLSFAETVVSNLSLRPEVWCDT